MSPGGTTVHRMIPGSYERPGGPECVCGRWWLMIEGRCDDGVDEDDAEWNAIVDAERRARIEETT